MNYGRYGRELLLELKRGDDAHQSAAIVEGNGSSGSGGGAPALPAYNDELVGNCLQDLRLHVQALQDQAQAVTATTAASSSTSSDPNAAGKPSMHVRPSLLLQNAAIQRNKRCLLAYHVGRVDRMKGPLYWQQGGDANKTISSAESHHQKVLCPAEQYFLQQYGQLVQRYTQQCGLSTDDLRACGMSVPIPGDRVQVRVITSPQLLPQGTGADEGVVLESGATVVLTPGSTHFLLWSDAEEYIRLGHLQILDSEENAG